MSAVLQFPQRSTEYLSTTELAKHIRGILRERFPSCTFSVRSSTYSGGSSIRIHWTDGPTRGYVESLVKNLEGSSFDGMIDLKSSRHAMLNGKQILTDFIFCERKLSAACLKRTIQAVGLRYHAPRESWPSVIEDQYDPRLDNASDTTSPVLNTNGERHWTWQSLVWRAAEDRTTLAP